MAIHGEPSPWAKKVRFVGPRLDFGGSLYDDYDLIEPPINFNLDDDVAKKTEELIREMYDKTIALLRQHDTALLKTVKVVLDTLNKYLINLFSNLSILNLGGTSALQTIKHNSPSSETLNKLHVCCASY